MADTFQFDLVAPERRLASTEAGAVTVPGTEGDITVMAGHTPVITTLRPGILRVEGQGEAQEYVVTGGFAEIAAESLTVLAERALPRSEMTQQILDEMMAEAEESHRRSREAEEHNVAADSAKLVADMVAMGSHIGLSPREPNL